MDDHAAASSKLKCLANQVATLQMQLQKEQRTRQAAATRSKQLEQEQREGEELIRELRFANNKQQQEIESTKVAC